MALPIPTLGAQPTDIFRLVGGYLGVRDGALATGAVRELDRFTAPTRRKFQREQWSWLISGSAELSFEELEAMLNELGASTVDLNGEEWTAYREAVASLFRSPPTLSPEAREEYITTTFPLFASIRDSEAPNRAQRWNAYYTLLNPERDYAAPPELTAELVSQISLTRLALAEGDFLTVLRTFALDSARYAANVGHSPNYSDLVARVLCRDELQHQPAGYPPDHPIPQVILHGQLMPDPNYHNPLPSPNQLLQPEEVKGRERNLLLTSLLIRGLCAASPHPTIAVTDPDGEFPRRVPALIWQALSVSGYNFLADQIRADGDPEDSVFSQWIFTVLHQMPGDDAKEIADRIGWMSILLDRLLVQGKLEVASATGWTYHDGMEWGAHFLPPERSHIPLEELLNSPLAMVTSIGREFEDSDQETYARVIEHLIQRGVQPERLRTWLAEIRNRVEAAP